MSSSANEERVRIKTISVHPVAKNYSSLVDALCDSDHSTATCMAILDAAAEDLKAAMAAAEKRPAAITWMGPHRAGGGLGYPDATGSKPGQTSGSEGWGRAVADANRAAESITGCRRRGGAS